jgi:hypothetical protein
MKALVILFSAFFAYFTLSYAAIAEDQFPLKLVSIDKLTILQSSAKKSLLPSHNRSKMAYADRAIG